MPIQNDNVIISPNDFLENNKRGEFYTGHVFGLGYAFVQHLPVEVFSGTDCYHPIIDIQCMYVDIIGYQLFVVNTVEKWMCFLLAYGRKPRFNVFNLILQEKCEFEVAK